ncbi:thiamine phosphate synthase [Halarcobacter mediterraneus]|uniref:Thiamine phosphate synthase n=1 Tax=Halarcobacter mediterraneus TaxID=2023153 RepID=A0A4V1M1D8_9BACT|nr:thiamine phosphate synthase [Halarcobacter mediterraneus]RXK13314.1 thiamine phosphate synthase [Halarcobacter mediterraneus]
MREDLISYLITHPEYYSNDPTLFERNLRKVLETKKVNMACFRDKTSLNYEELATLFVNICKEFNIERVLLNENYQLAKKINAHGVHLTSKQFNDIQKAKDLDLYTIISCHNFTDIENAQKKHINAVTYSPIFISPNKGEPKGIAELRELVRAYEDLDIIALGGIISKESIELISKTKAYGFASIRYFV